MKSIDLPEHIVVQPDIQGDMIDKYRHPHRFELGCFIMVHSGNDHISINLTDYEVSANSLFAKFFKRETGMTPKPYRVS